MNGSLISIILITVAFAALAFIVTFILSAKLGAGRIASDKRMEELKKNEQDFDVSLVKSESKSSKRKKDRKNKKSSVTTKLGTALYGQLQSADIKMRPEEFLFIWVLVAALPALVLILIIPTAQVLAIVLVAVCAVIPFAVIKIKQKKRVKKFDEQLGDALMIACSSLRSGLSFIQAMEAIAKDMPDPVASEFATVLAENAMGTSMDEAMERLNARINSEYLPLMVSSVLIQRQTGGNLSSILEGIADAIKEKMKLKKELKSSTASGRTTALMVGSMPIILCVIFFLVNREFVLPLFTTSMGHKFLIAAASLEILCFLMVKKILNVKM